MKKIGVLIVVLFIVFPIYAQRTTDVEGGKDYPLLSRFEGAVIEFFKDTKFGTYKVPLNNESKLSFSTPMELKGRVLRIQYSISKDNNPEFVLHNYKKAFEEAGLNILTALANEQLGVGERSQDWNSLYYGPGDAFFTNALNNGKFGLYHHVPNWKANMAYIVASGEKDEKQIIFAVYVVEHNNFTLINQDVIEVDAPKTGMVTAEKLSKGIDTDGRAAIYGIYFDTGSASIKPESVTSLKLIAEYLKTVKDRKFYIVGHTDNVGNIDDNMELSQKRAEAVKDKLVDEYEVSADQLNAYGVASLNPVASNSTKEGKAKNRRVEIVEQ